jgi:hypothetical protein
MWIKCSDRLPGDGAYLCWNSQRGCVEIFLFHCGSWATLAKKYVTHWMPLPNPPAAGQGESAPTSTNTARNAIALVRQFARENGHSEGGTMDQYLDRLEERATASVA